jgi:hypothetical protein
LFLPSFESKSPIKKTQNHNIDPRSVVLLVTDILQGAVLQPILDLLPDPDRCVNFLIAVSFDPDPSRRFPPPSGQRVQLLDHFVTAHQESRQSVRNPETV